MLSHSVEGECKECGSDDVGYSTKEKSSIWKVYGECHSCGRDYGRIGIVKRKDIDHKDQVYEKAEEKAQRFFK